MATNKGRNRNGSAYSSHSLRRCLGTVIRMGVARGLFSNEAGLGTGGIAAAAARTDVPPRQALVSMTQVFIDTIIVCTITGVSLTMAGLYTSGTEGAALTAQSFDQLLPGFGHCLLSSFPRYSAGATLVKNAFASSIFISEKCPAPS